MAVKRRPRRDESDDEPEEERRPRRSRRDDDDEEDEPPARRSRRDRDDDEDEDDRPRRSRRSRDDDDDEPEEKPRRRSRDEDDEDEPPRRSRRSRDDDDEEDEDDNRRRRRSKREVKTGWDGANEVRSTGSDFAVELKVGEKAELVKFLDDEPVAAWRQHWVDAPIGTRKKSWTCLEDDCPLCGEGDRPRKLFAFNLLHLAGTLKGDPVNKVLVIGVQALEQLKNFAEDPKTGPLTKLYWSISKVKKGGYSFQAVKERDLEEDWDLEPLSKSELREAEESMYSAEDVVFFPSRRDMQVQADAYVASDEDDD